LRVGASSEVAASYEDISNRPRTSQEHAIVSNFDGAQPGERKLERHRIMLTAVISLMAAPAPHSTEPQMKVFMILAVDMTTTPTSRIVAPAKAT
jgi:hypothetical protein